MPNTIKIIGIDPGTSITGFGVVQKNGSHLQHVDSGIIKINKKLSLAEKLAQIHQEITTLITLHQPQALAIEEVFYGKNVRSAIILSHARGVIMSAASMMGLSTHEYSALEIKRASVGYGRASKEQIFEMIQRLLNLTQSQIASFDQTDALSCAICHLNQFDLQQRIRTLSNPN